MFCFFQIDYNNSTINFWFYCKYIVAFLYFFGNIEYIFFCIYFTILLFLMYWRASVLINSILVSSAFCVSSTILSEDNWRLVVSTILSNIQYQFFLLLFIWQLYAISNFVTSGIASFSFSPSELNEITNGYLFF